MSTRVFNNTVDDHYLHKPGFYVVPLESSAKETGTALTEVVAAAPDERMLEGAPATAVTLKRNSRGNKIPTDVISS